MQLKFTWNSEGPRNLKGDLIYRFTDLPVVVPPKRTVLFLCKSVLYAASNGSYQLSFHLEHQERMLSPGTELLVEIKSSDKRN